MSVTLKITEDHADVAVAGKCTVAQAMEFKEALLSAIRGARRVTLDFSEATSVDVSAFQLICAAHRSAQSAGVEMDFSPMTESMVSTIEEVGFQRHMPCSYDDSGRCLFCMAERKGDEQ